MAGFKLRRIPELLAPAGNMKALHAGVFAGADAVYLGLGAFNARRNADNFTLDILPEALDFAHLRGVKIYVTMNTIILPSEITEAFNLAKKVASLGADGVIVQDIGLASLISRCLPMLPLHISTQMNVHNEYGIEAASALGAKRVTLARELSLEQIAHIARVADDLGMEVETFAHGALCVCYSGQCFMSSMIGGRSANRGLCAQACRLPYDLVVDENGSGGQTLNAPGEFLLSPKDLCTIDRLSELTQAGVSSLKVEGRMKSAEYVFSVVSTYRKVLDRLEAQLDHGVSGQYPATSRERETLASVFSRGFSESYLSHDRSNDIMSYSRPNNRGQFAGRVKSIDGNAANIAKEIDIKAGDLLEFWTRRGNVTYKVPQNFECGHKAIHLPLDALGDEAHSIRVSDRVFRVRSVDAEFSDDGREPRVGVRGRVSLHIGEPLEVEFALDDARVENRISNRGAIEYEAASIAAKAIGNVVEKARSKVVTREDVQTHIDRLGQTPFAITDLDIHLDEGVGIPFSELHHCRASALENLQEEILKAFVSNANEREQEFGDSQDSESVVLDVVSKADHARSRSKESLHIYSAVLATNPECARAAKRVGADLIYVPALNYKRGQATLQGRLIDEAGQAGFPKSSILVMPVVDPDFEDKQASFDVWEYVSLASTVVADSLGALQHARELGVIPEAGHHIPITNLASVDVARAFRVSRIWLSPELNLAQIKDLISQARSLFSRRQNAAEDEISFAIKVQGREELMITEHCELMSQGACSQGCESCSRRKRAHCLKDRKGYGFPVMTDAFGRSHIFNGIEQDVVSALSGLIDAGVSTFLVDSTFMDAEQTAQATGRLLRAIEDVRAGAMPKLPNTTSGHLFRGIY